MKLRIYTFTLVLLSALLIACEIDSKKVKDLNDIRPRSEGKQTNNKSETTINKDTLQPYLEAYNQDSVALKIVNLSNLESKHFINRFQPLVSLSYSLTTKDSTLELTHTYWSFKDSLYTNNAFFNWLDIEKNSKIYNPKALEKSFFMAIICDNSIDFISASKNLDPLNWLRFVKFNRKYKSISYILIQKRKSKTQWFTFTANKLTEIKKK